MNLGNRRHGLSDVNTKNSKLHVRTLDNPSLSTPVSSYRFNKISERASFDPESPQTLGKMRHRRPVKAKNQSNSHWEQQ